MILSRIFRVVVSLIAIFVICLILLHYKEPILNTVTEMRDFIIDIFNSIFGV